MIKEQSLFALFETPHEGQLALRALTDAGYPREDLSLVMPDEERTRTGRTARSSREIDDDRLTAKRVTTGASIGGAAGAIAGLTALAIPGIGPLLAVGPIIAALGGAGAGAVAGALGGTLVDIGIPKEKLDFYSKRLGEGHAMVAVRAPEHGAAQAEAIFRERGAIDIGRLEEPATSAQRGLNAPPDAEEQTREHDAGAPVRPLV